MNKIFNLIWSKTKEKWIVVSEKVKGNGKVPSSPLLSIAVLTALFSSGGVAYGIDSSTLPTGGQIAAGSGTITSSGTQMTINQTTQQLIANWATFNIGENAAVRFNQPGIAAVALNRIADRNPSQILGSLTSNGQVFLLNSSGIIFGKNATVNVGGLVASSLNMADSDFFAGKYTLSGNNSAGAILNQGAIKALDGGVVALMAPKVTNEGSITANSGSALLAAGNLVTLDFTGDGLINYTVDQGAVDALVENRGLIKADGGVVVMTARAADALRIATATNSGVIEAHTLQNKAGRILLLSDMENGQGLVSGRLDASAPDGGNGGFIETSGGRVNISDGTVVTTLATQEKSGTWLIDPTDFTIGGTSPNMTVSTVQQSLATGDLTIESSAGTPGGFGDINVNDAVSWSLNCLTLTAARDININAVMTASGSASLEMNTATANGADLAVPGGTVKVGFNADGTFKGRVDFSDESSLTINGHSYTIINDIQGLQVLNSAGYNALGSNLDNNNSPFNPISFQGTFDGLGHTITKLNISKEYDNNIGLFGYNSGTIRNIGLVNAIVVGEDNVGALVGYNNGGTITNSYATGSVTSTGDYGDNIGGLVGRNGNGTITSSYAKGSVSVSGYDSGHVGGLVGYNNGTITKSYAETGAITMSGDIGDYAGGLVGYNDGGNISDSHATGTVDATCENDDDGESIGGLVGYNNGGRITNSYATGNVKGSDYVGGLVGYNFGGTITDSYATSNVTGTGDDVGGLVGNVGDLLGRNYAFITNSFYDMGVTTINVGNGNNGTVTAAVTPYGINSTLFTDWLSAANGKTAKTLDVAKYFTADSDGYYQITSISTTDFVTKGNIQNILGFVNDTNANKFRLTANIDLKIGETNTGFWIPLFNAAELDGAGFAFTNLLVNQPMNDTLGMIGSLGAGSTIKNLTVTDLAVTGDYCVGGLVGLNNVNDTLAGGTILNSSTTGSVTGSSSAKDAGGLVGDNYGTVTNSHSTVTVTGGSYIGGLAGHNGSTSSITNSHATGSVTGKGNNVGGLVGYNDNGTICNSYATTGSVEGNDSVGGLVGYNGASGSIEDNSYAEGSVTGSGSVGGLVGHNDGGNITSSHATGIVKGTVGSIGGLVGYNDEGNITNSYATGGVDGGDHVGGLVGYNRSDGDTFSILNCYAKGKVTGSDYVGGLVGQNKYGSITSSYAEGEVDGRSGDDVGGLVGHNDYGTISNSHSKGNVTGDDDVGGLVGHNDGYIVFERKVVMILYNNTLY